MENMNMFGKDTQSTEGESTDFLYELGKHVVITTLTANKVSISLEYGTEKVVIGAEYTGRFHLYLRDYQPNYFKISDESSEQGEILLEKNTGLFKEYLFDKSVNGLVFISQSELEHRHIFDKYGVVFLNPYLCTLSLGKQKLIIHAECDEYEDCRVYAYLI